MNKIMVTLFGFDIYWYGFLSALSAVLGLQVAKYFYPNDHCDILGNYVIAGIVLGGRLGYFLFYFPLEIMDFFLIRQGGMAFHGALLGVGVAIYIYSKVYSKSFLCACDIGALVTPIGLFFGRVANYINGEIIGTSCNFFSSNMHPVALYEAFFEGFLLFLILIRFALQGKTKTNGYIFSMFIIFYGMFRFFVEFFRMPDGMVLFLSMGQFLSLIMFLIGLYINKKFVK